MAVLVTALSTEFTPTKTVFSINVDGGEVAVLRKLESGATFQNIGKVSGSGVNVENVVGSVYKLEATYGIPTVRAAE